MIHFVTYIFATSCPAGAVLVDGVCNGTDLPVVNASHDQLQQVLQLTFGVVAALAVLFIVIGGLRFVLSEGDPQGSAKARNTLIYAIVGLLVAISAEAIVSFVLNRTG